LPKKQFFARKSLDLLMEEMAGEHRLHRVLGPIALSSLGIGCIIGAGIFVLVGQVARNTTGPALILSFIIAGTACVFAGLCYAEFASMAPVAGSAYTYAYATMGELLAWIIGWDLVLEYAVSSAAVAHAWSHYFQDFLHVIGEKFLDNPNLAIPEVFRNAPFDYNSQTGHFFLTGAWFDLPAVVISGLITVILVIGIRESARFNALMVITKVGIVLLVIGLGAFYVNPENWRPFAPYGYSGFSFFGKTVMGQTGKSGEPLGMVAGAAIIFFAYIGFDSVSTHAEEAKNPKRDVPIAIISSLLICTILYIGVAGVLTGMVPYNQLNINAPVSDAFGQVGLPWAQMLIAIGAVTGITSVLLVTMLSQPRVLLAMARDGLLPQSFFGAVHPRFATPYKSTILTGFVVASLSSLLPLKVLAELVSIGTLFAFVVVCIAVIIMRRTRPDFERPFRVPLMPYTALGGIGFCLLLMFSLPWENWARLAVWLAAGLAIYFIYGQHHSHLGKQLAEEIKLHGVSPAGVPRDDIKP
jgi:APA family basic amino acid/polyamine antiporter